MTERFEPAGSADHPGPAPAPADPDGRLAHLVGTYSPRWLSGPSHYQGLVATFAPDEDEPDRPGAAPTGSPA